ncbi:MAG: hypothetical protein LBJ67_00770 [Planctomycetaceae bacterium]|nr:hypothetical protein [Planctomycetaceae bacterium]
MTDSGHFQETTQHPNNKNRFWLSGSTWLLICGLLLLNLKYFLQSKFSVSVLYLFDVRLCPWWYFLCLAVLIVLSVRWFLILRNDAE